MRKKMYCTMAAAVIMGIGTFMMNARNVNAGMLEAATKSAERYLEEAARGNICDDSSYENDAYKEDIYDDEAYENEAYSDRVELSIAGKEMQVPSSINEWKEAGFEVEPTGYERDTTEFQNGTRYTYLANGSFITLPGYNFRIQAQVENDMVTGLFFNNYQEVLESEYPEISFFNGQLTLGQPTSFHMNPYEYGTLLSISHHDSNSEQIDIYLPDLGWFGGYGDPDSRMYTSYGYKIDEHEMGFLVNEDEEHTLAGFYVTKGLK